MRQPAPFAFLKSLNLTSLGSGSPAIRSIGNKDGSAASAGCSTLRAIITVIFGVLLPKLGELGHLFETHIFQYPTNIAARWSGPPQRYDAGRTTRPHLFHSGFDKVGTGPSTSCHL